jgi:hypothetical protein
LWPELWRLVLRKEACFDREHEWSQPKRWRPNWELWKGEEVVARLSSPTFFGTTMRGSWSGRDYVLRKGGLRRPMVAIRELGGDDDLLVLSYDTSTKGTISRFGVPDYAWERPYRGEVWSFMGEGKGLLFTVHRDVRGSQPRGLVDIKGQDPCLGPLLLLTWFMVSTADP